VTRASSTTSRSTRSRGWPSTLLDTAFVSRTSRSTRYSLTRIPRSGVWIRRSS
jgi:hypothetical protein